jgi:hypothetical protein
VDRDAHLLVIRFQLGQEAALVQATKARRGTLGDRETVGSVTASGDGEAFGLKLRQRVFAERLEHPVAILGPRSLGPLDEALVHERAEDLERSVRGESAHGRSAFQRGAGDEDSQGMEQIPLLGREELVAPGDGFSKRLLPALHVMETLPEHLERTGLRQPVEHRSGCVSPDPSRRQLDRQRQAVQPLTERQNVTGVLVRELEAR